MIGLILLPIRVLSLPLKIAVESVEVAGKLSGGGRRRKRRRPARRRTRVRQSRSQVARTPRRLPAAPPPPMTAEQRADAIRGVGVIAALAGLVFGMFHPIVLVFLVPSIVLYGLSVRAGKKEQAEQENQIARDLHIAIMEQELDQP